MIPRKISDKILNILTKNHDSSQVVLLEGARQVGKTTLVRQLAKKAKLSMLELNLERDPPLCESIEQTKTFEEFSELLLLKFKYTPGKDQLLFIDEAQECSRLGSYVRFMKEDWPAASPVILTGSSMGRLISGRFPVGRVTQIELLPFSFFEFLDAIGEAALLNILIESTLKKPPSATVHTRALELFRSYLEVGGMPAAVNAWAAKAEWQEILHQLLLGYRADFRRVYNDNETAYLWAALQATSVLQGQPFHNSFVSKILDGGTPSKIIEALSRLEQWRLSIPVAQRTLKMESVAHPKRYLFDHGLGRVLRHETSVAITDKMSTIDQRNQGGFFEGVVFNSLRQSFAEIVGWRKGSSGSEVDFAVPFGNGVLLIEVKAAPKLKGTHLGGLLGLMSLQKMQRGVVVSMAPLEQRVVPFDELDRTIVNIPVYLVERITELLPQQATH
jgi:predicted AAA+ superfamily ATPase